MKIMTVALGTALVLNLGTYSAAAHSQKAKVVREPRAIIRVPVVWDYYSVPRYRYGPPVVPVIRYGNQEVYVPPWTWPEMYMPPWISPGLY
jgi:hypothetical protein